MGRYYSKIKSLFETGSNGESNAPPETVTATTTEKPRSLKEFLNPPLRIKIIIQCVKNCADTPNELPIYEATTRELNKWHANGCNVFLQDLLREYELDFSSKNVAASSHFKIGYDYQNHRATFALDDTHFHAIEFNKYDAAPVDDDAARRVLERIAQLRQARSKRREFCGYMLEYFD